MRSARLTLVVLLAALFTVASVDAASARPVNRYYTIGDSVMLDARPSLYHQLRSVHVDAAVSRQASAGVRVLRWKKRHHLINDVTVFALGTNGSFTRAQLAALMRLTSGHKLVVLTSHCPSCSWTAGNNAMIHRWCTPSRHCFLADFQRWARVHPGWFVGDGVHMPVGGRGARAYAHIVKMAILRAVHHR